MNTPSTEWPSSLTDDELDELDRYLRGHADEGRLLLDGVHGMLSAIARIAQLPAATVATVFPDRDLVLPVAVPTRTRWRQGAFGVLPRVTKPHASPRLSQSSRHEPREPVQHLSRLALEIRIAVPPPRGSFDPV